MENGQCVVCSGLINGLINRPNGANGANRPNRTMRVVNFCEIVRRVIDEENLRKFRCEGVRRFYGDRSEAVSWLFEDSLSGIFHFFALTKLDIYSPQRQVNFEIL